MYPTTDFDTKNTYKFWQDMVKTHRLVFTDEYWNFFNRFYERLTSLTNKNPNIDVNISKETTDIAKYGSIEVSMKNVTNILVILTLKDSNKNKMPLLVCVHFDGHALELGGTAYDDAIHVAAMEGCIEALLSSQRKMKASIYFLFDGSKEF